MQGFCLWDTVGCDISGYFGPAAQLIHTALEGGGKVVINCQMGVSRSSVLTMAYMILVRQWSVLHTITEFRLVLLLEAAQIFYQLKHLQEEARRETKRRLH